VGYGRGAVMSEPVACSGGAVGGCIRRRGPKLGLGGTARRALKRVSRTHDSCCGGASCDKLTRPLHGRRCVARACCGAMLCSSAGHAALGYPVVRAARGERERRVTRESRLRTWLLGKGPKHLVRSTWSIPPFRSCTTTFGAPAQAVARSALASRPPLDATVQFSAWRPLSGAGGHGPVQAAQAQSRRGQAGRCRGRSRPSAPQRRTQAARWSRPAPQAWAATDTQQARARV
jgi:hypothetical protein